jgi:serine/threonine protein kinase
MSIGGGIAPALRGGAMSIGGGIAPALRGGAMSIGGGIAPALRGGAMSIGGGIAPALRGGAMSIGRAPTRVRIARRAMTDRCPRCSADLASGANYCARCGAFVSTPAAPDERDALIGAVVLGRYRVVRLLGEGGMGKVYLAEQSMGQATRPVALKTLRRELTGDPKVSGRFLRESEIVIRLAHPNTIQFYDFGQLDDGTMVIVMEYIEGHTLFDELRRGPLSLARIDALMAQICGSLAEAHAHGIVHRDLKPQNVLLTSRAGQTDFVKVLDFGIAMRRSEDEQDPTRLTTHGTLVGTPPYMSPEQFQDRDVDARSDVYSLGVMLYQLLTGELPFDAKTAWQWAAAHIDLPPKPLADHQRTKELSPQRAEAVMRALAKDPAARPRDAAALFREFAGSGAVSATLDRPSGGRGGTGDGDGSVAPQPPPLQSVERSKSVGLSWLPIALLAGAGALITWRNAQVAPDVPVTESSVKEARGQTQTVQKRQRSRSRAASPGSAQPTEPSAVRPSPRDAGSEPTKPATGASADEPEPTEPTHEEQLLATLRSALRSGEIEPAVAAMQSAQQQLAADQPDLPELRARLGELARDAAKSLTERGECDRLRRLAAHLAQVGVGDPAQIRYALDSCQASPNSQVDAGINSATED